MTQPGKIPQGEYGEATGIIVAKIWYPALMRGYHNYSATYDLSLEINKLK